MDPNTFQQFARALLTLNGPALINLLPRLSADDVKHASQALLSGMLVGPEIDPTNVLCAGDVADQHLHLPAHAIVLYDVALQHMDENRQSIAPDTNCSAASLNLIDLLVKSGQQPAAASAARRAARMPVKRAEQNVQIALWLVEIGETADTKTAYTLFQRGKSGLAAVAAEMGVTIADLLQIERALARGAGAG